MSILVRTGRFFFEWRDKLPVPLALSMPFVARPSLRGWLLGLSSILIGQLLRIWSLMHIGPTTRTRAICADRLVSSGPYACCRNPLYLANIFKIAGFCFIACSFKFALLVAVFYLLEFSSIISFEEDFLAKKFPEEFEKYKKAVPSVLPRLRIKGPNEKSAEFTFLQACRSEKKTFFSTLAILSVMMVSTLLKREKMV
jgi:protein-S-isoprenylcysteine O-methyltransferase Ste14